MFLHHHPWSTHLVISIISCLEGTDRRGSPKNSQKSGIKMIYCQVSQDCCWVTLCGCSYIEEKDCGSCLVNYYVNILHEHLPRNNLALIYRDKDRDIEIEIEIPVSCPRGCVRCRIMNAAFLTVRGMGERGRRGDKEGDNAAWFNGVDRCGCGWSPGPRWHLMLLVFENT